jgi:putative IMPACT (imprinted ancient) family translation regulator
MLAGGQSAANDDGEPSGTAGRPIRAYTDTIAQALQAAQKIPFQRRVQLGCRLPYPLEGMLRRELATAGARLIGADHQTQVEVRFELPEPDRSALIVRINEVGQGLIEWIDVDIDIDLDVMAERGTEVG